MKLKSFSQEFSTLQHVEEDKEVVSYDVCSR